MRKLDERMPRWNTSIFRNFLSLENYSVSLTSERKHPSFPHRNSDVSPVLCGCLARAAPTRLPIGQLGKANPWGYRVLELTINNPHDWNKLLLRRGMEYNKDRTSKDIFKTWYQKPLISCFILPVEFFTHHQPTPKTLYCLSLNMQNAKGVDYVRH